MSELVQAMVIIATFHSLCSFVLGCGIAPEIDMPGGTYEEAETLIQNFQLSELASPDEEIFTHSNQLMHRLKEKSTFVEKLKMDVQQREVFETCDSSETFSIEQMEKLEADRQRRSATTIEKSLNFIFEDMSRFKGGYEMRHEDFDVKSSEYSVFRLQDYSWEDHGCALVSKFLPETGEYLDEEFNSILNLTDYSLFNSTSSVDGDRVDTWPFRQAIWYYVLRLSGMSHDDYDYHEVNIYLNKRIKQYIKKVACYPEDIVLSDFGNMGFSFRPDEKCQINLLASEARKCAELLYALHTLNLHA